MVKKADQDNVPQDKQEPITPASFADKLEALMNEAYQQSQEGDHKHLWSAWCNELGDLWRKVKAHA